MNTRSWWMVLVLGSLVPGVCRAQPPQFPQSWHGVWEFSSTDRSCEDGSFIEAYADTDTICAGETFGFAEEGLEFDCTGTIDDDSIDLMCSYTQELFPGCTQTLAYTVTGTLNGDNATGTERFSITYEGDCLILEDECTDTEIAGVRLDPTPEGCTVPTLPTSWGSLKALYR